MAQWEIHYEIYGRQGSSGGWNLLGVTQVREAALLMAQQSLAARKSTGVRVVKESYDAESGGFLSLRIFENNGKAELTLDPAAEELPHALPCLVINDLYAPPARAIMAQLLSAFLTRHKLTVSELIHRADALERLEATGTVYQHAIQKAALAQAAMTKLPIHSIMKSLDRLATEAMHRVYRDTRHGYFTATIGLHAFADSVCSQDDAAYRLTAALAIDLAPCEGWTEKLRRLLAVLDEAPLSGSGRSLLFQCVDMIAAELLHTPAALREFFGVQENLAVELTMLVELFLGNVCGVVQARRELDALARHFARDDLFEARFAIAQRIMAELRSMRRLCPQSVADELQAARRIAARLVACEGKYLTREDIAAVCVRRSRRLVSQEYVREHLAPVASMDEKLERLLAIEEHVVGEQNKRQLAAYALPLVTSPQFEAHFLSDLTPAQDRLKRIAELQGRLRRSGLEEDQRAELSFLLDKLASEVEARARLFECIVATHCDPAERVAELLTMCAAGTFTEGKMLSRARDIILSNVSQPGFFTRYVALGCESGEAADAESAMTELLQSLQKAGIPQDAGLEAIAA